MPERKINERAWGDIYDIPSMREYVHTNPENFMNQYKTHLTSIDDAYKYFYKVMKVFLRDHLNYWKTLEAGLISQAKQEEVISTTMTSREFIIEYNKQFTALREEGDLSWDLFEFKEIAGGFTSKQDNARKTTTKKGRERSTQKMLDYMVENLEKILVALVNIFNGEYEIHYRWAKFMGYSPAKLKKIIPNISDAKEGIREIFRMLGIDAGKGDTIDKKEFEKILAILKDYDENINPMNSKGQTNSKHKLAAFYTLSTRARMKTFMSGKNWGSGILGILGRTLEDAESIRIVEEKIEKKILAKEDGMSTLKATNIGEGMKKDTVADVVHFKYKIGSSKINAGVSQKLTKTPGVLGKEYGTQEILDNPYIESKFTGSGFGIDGSITDIIYWLRSNMQALQYVSIYTEGSDGDFTLKESKKFFEYEKNLAGLLGIPRLLDGVYEYSEDEIKQREVKGQIYWTSMINVKGTFIWMSDILEQILSGISDDGDISGLKGKIEITGSTWSENSASSKELWSLWNEKRVQLKNLKEEVSYAKLYDNIGMFKTLSSRASISKTPYKRITMDLQLGYMKNALNIPTHI